MDTTKLTEISSCQGMQLAIQRCHAYMGCFNNRICPQTNEVGEDPKLRGSQIHDRYNLVNHVNMKISCLTKYATNISVTDWIIYGDRAGIQENQGICLHDTSISLPGSTCMLKSWHSSVKSLEMALHLKSFVAGAVYCLYQ